MNKVAAYMLAWQLTNQQNRPPPRSNPKAIDESRFQSNQPDDGVLINTCMIYFSLDLGVPNIEFSSR